MTLACQFQVVEQAQKQFKTVKNASISAAHVPDRDNCEEPGNSCAALFFLDRETVITSGAVDKDSNGIDGAIIGT